MSLFMKGMDEAYGTKPMEIGENGTLEYAVHQVGDALVAFFFALVRNIPENRLKSLFRDCIQQVQLPHITGGDKTRMIADLFVLAFQTRDCRGGKGERQLFYKLFIELYDSYPQTVLSCLPLLAEYGYYKDYFNILAEIGLNSQFSGLKNRIFDILVNQLIADEAAIDTYEEKQHLKAEAKAEGSSSTSKMGGGPSVSLCGKYCPRESNHWQEANKELFREFLSRLFPENADATRGKILYRKLIVKLTAAIDVPEVKMCGKRFAEIEIPKIPSVCMKKNRKAFANEKLKGALKPSETETGNRSTEEDRILCRKHLMEALKNKKIKGKQNFPHEIVHLLMDHRKHPSAVELEIFQNQWEAIRNDIVEQMAKKAADGNTAGVNLGKLVPLVDVSGSMAGTPMEVAIALGILISELNHPSFRNRFITFETNPSWCDLSRATTIDQKVNIAKAASWGGSTNIEKAFDLIAAVVEKNRLPSSEIPSLIIFSDMQFDMAVGTGAKQTQLARIKTRFANLGNKLYGKPLPAPTIIFWNLRGNTSGFPAQANSDNVQMLSGFSPSLFKHVVDGTDLKEDEKPNPYDTFRKAMDDERYNNVRKILNDSQEGFLAQYSFTA